MNLIIYNTYIYIVISDIAGYNIFKFEDHYQAA